MDFKKFLVKAKVATYAGSGEEKINEDGAKELIFEEGEFRYKDRYYGDNPFSGEEVVWKNGTEYWVMNYYGNVFSSDLVSIKEVTNFLKEAMKQVKEDRPFRGLSNFKYKDLEYVDESTGEVDSFVGTEKILFNGEEVYRLDYHGGLVKLK